jgi:hypothetical protein
VALALLAKKSYMPTKGRSDTRSKTARRAKNGPSREGPICLGSLWLGELVADALVCGQHLAILEEAV